MPVCRRPDCDRDAADHALGFCAQDHAVYLRTRERHASLVEAAQLVHADVFSLVPAPQRQMLAEYLVAVASEDLPAVSSDIPRSAVLMAAALVARGRSELRMRSARRARRRSAPTARCRTVGGTAL